MHMPNLTSLGVVHYCQPIKCGRWSAARRLDCHILRLSQFRHPCLHHQNIRLQTARTSCRAPTTLPNVIAEHLST